MSLTIDRTINNIEDKLTIISAFPVVGTVAGCAKVLMGAAQALTALACGILAFIPSTITGDWSLVKYSWTHIKHGGGNMVAGTIEAIPLVQTVAFGIRVFCFSTWGDPRIRVNPGYEWKLMPYTSLIEQDWDISGAEEEKVEQVKLAFQQKLQQNGGSQNVPVKKQMELAQEAIIEQAAMIE